VDARADDEGKGLVLTDGMNSLHVFAIPKEDSVILTHSGKNDPAAIRQALEDAFGIRLVSEYDDEYGALTVRILHE